VSQQWLDRCAVELRRQRIPRRVAAKLLGELRDHFVDLVEEESMSELPAELRMGDPSAVAERAATEYRRRPGKGKWLALSAIPLLAAGLIVAFLVPVGILSLVPENQTAELQTENMIGPVVVWWLQTVPWLFASALLFWWSVRIQARRNWLMIAFGQLAVLAAFFYVTFQPKTVNELGSLSIGFRYPPTLYPSQIPALVAVMLFAAFAWRRTPPIAKWASYS
jgi:hypothetical protein